MVPHSRKGLVRKYEMFTVEERTFVKDSITKGAEKILTKDGKELIFDGRSVFKDDDGSLVDAQGNSILTKDGKRIFVDKDGRLVDEDGKPVNDPKFETIEHKSVSSGLKEGLEQITTTDGKSVKYKGRDVFKNSDGSLVDENGNEIVINEGVDVVPSREAVRWTSATRNFLKKQFEQAQEEATALVEKELSETDFIKWLKACKNLIF